MLLQDLWFLMLAASLVQAVASGRGDVVLPAALQGAANAVSVSIKLLSGYLFFCGLMAIVTKLQIHRAISKWFRKPMERLMGCPMDDRTSQAVCMNLSANLLGLGNAATPYGMEAARLLEAAPDGQSSRHGLYMLLILNATSLQLLPTTVLTLRIAAGSQQPNAILLPSLASSCVATVTGVVLGLVCQKVQRAIRRQRSRSEKT